RNLTCSTNIKMTPSKQHTIRSPRFTCWHPLLPAFSARIIIALRTLIGIAVGK
ncbi:unnamed protein product, partial [Rotaria sp. Silwood2]